MANERIGSSRKHISQENILTAEERLEQDARDYIVRFGKMQASAKKDRGIDLPNISLAEAKERVLKLRKSVEEWHLERAALKKGERDRTLRARKSEQEFMNRPDESFTLEEYEDAQSIGFSGHLSENDNNPNRDSDAPYAGNARRFLRIEKALKRRGLIPASKADLIGYMLDDLYPKAESKQEVDYEGKRYRCRYEPLSKSRSGKTVYAWRRYWEEV